MFGEEIIISLVPRFLNPNLPAYVVVSILNMLQDRFRQYLLPFSSECCMHSSVKLTLFLSFCVGVKFGVLGEEKNAD
jgi:hypothetical protein